MLGMLCRIFGALRGHPFWSYLVQVLVRGASGVLGMGRSGMACPMFLLGYGIDLPDIRQALPAQG